LILQEGPSGGNWPLKLTSHTEHLTSRIRPNSSGQKLLDILWRLTVRLVLKRSRRLSKRGKKELLTASFRRFAQFMSFRISTSKESSEPALVLKL
jgi:hypothetical protein